MPVYFAHGFRWPRDGFTGVRVHAIVHNLEDMSVEYIQTQTTREVLLRNFRELHPQLMAHLEDDRTGRTIHFLEQYDPEDELSETAVSQKYAFVADRVITIAGGKSGLRSTAALSTSMPPQSNNPSQRNSAASRGASSRSSISPAPRQSSASLSLNVEDALASGPAVTPQQWEALAELRDKLAEGEKIGWWIIYNGDPDRPIGDEDDDYRTADEDDAIVEEDEGAKTPTQHEPLPAPNGVLGLPIPSLLSADMKNVAEIGQDKQNIGTAIPHPPPPVLKPAQEQAVPPRPKGSKGFVNPLSLRKKSSRANLQPPPVLNDNIPEPPKLKEINKREGFRHKFFGRSDKK